MTREEHARQAALAAFKEAIAAGVDREVALGVALARFRSVCPAAAEWEMRTWLAKALAAERIAEAQFASARVH